MISFGDLLALLGLGTFMYLTYQLKQLVDVLRSANFSNYQSYKEAIREGEKRDSRPQRKRDEVGIHRINGDVTKVTTMDANGVAHTQDADISIYDANPETVMAAIDSQVAYVPEDA